MSESGMRVEPGGFASKPKPASPRAIEASGYARDSFTRLIICGVVLLLLIVCFGIAMWQKLEYARDILLVVSSTLGFLAGREYSKKNEG